MIDVYGNSYQIELYDPRKHLNNIIDKKNINKEENRKYNSEEKVHKINQNQKTINCTEQEKTVYFNKLKEQEDQILYSMQGYHPRLCQHVC